MRIMDFGFLIIYIGIVKEIGQRSWFGSWICDLNANNQKRTDDEYDPLFKIKPLSQSDLINNGKHHTVPPTSFGWWEDGGKQEPYWHEDAASMSKHIINFFLRENESLKF